ncbi:MAG: C39 family peptidase [Lachnospiraceae bacterium]|nr:C39 family peptidase [Lachnospiraceae bacterium]
MSVQRKEIQVIPVQRNYGYEKRNWQQNSAVFQRKKKHKYKKKTRRSGVVIGLAMILLTLCVVTNWFTEMPVIGKNARIEYLTEQGIYPKELLELLKKNEETYDFVRNYPNREKYQSKHIDLSKDVKKAEAPLLMQWDKRWGYDLYGDTMIALSGCGPTCMTMAYLYHTKDTTMHPGKMAEYAQEEGYHSKEGTSWEFWTKGAEDLGMYGEEISLDENIMKAVLDADGVIVCSMSPGDFTDGGHYILLRGYDEKGFFVNDPNRKSNSKKQWDFKTLQKQMKNLWAIYAL